MDSIMPVCTASLDHFDVVTVEELTKIISCMNKTTFAFYETGPRYLSELIKKHNSSNRTRRANNNNNNNLYSLHKNMYIKHIDI